MAGGKIEIDVEPNLQGFDGKVSSGLRNSIGPLGAVSKGLGVAIAAGTGIAAIGLKAVIDKGIEYQNNLNELQAVSHATGMQMSQVGTVAKALGADMTLPATSAADAAAAMSELAKGGLNVDQAMTAAKGTLQLAAAAQIDAAGAATIQSQALNAFGLSADNAGHVADVLANTANAASGEITDFAQALSAGGAVAHQFGLSLDETSTTLGLFANAGIKGSDAGTLLKSALLALANPSKPASKAIEELGLKTYDATGKFVGMKSIFDQLHTASGHMTDAQYQQATATVFGSDAVRLAGVAAQTTSSQWDTMATAIGRSGGAAEVAAAKTKGLGGAWEGFKSQVETAGLGIFEAIAPPLEAAVKQGSKLVEQLGPKVADGIKIAVDAGKAFGPGIANAIESRANAVGDTVGRIFRPILDGAKNLANAGINIAITAVQGFTGTLREAVSAVQPVADGIGRLETSVAQANGPLGAFRVALQLGYDAAKLALSVLSPLIGLVGGAVSVFSGLPGPIQTAALALLALRVGPAILGSLRNALSGVGKEAADGATNTGVFGRAVSTITAPVRAVASGLTAAAGTARQFSGEMSVQRGLADAAGQSIGRMGSATAAFNTSALPAVAAARNFRDQAVAIREGAASAGQPISAMGAAMGTIVERSSGLSAIRSAFQNASEGATRFGTVAGVAAAAGTGLKTAASGIVGALGGPWGIALAAAGAGLAILSGKQQDAAASAQAYQARVTSLADALAASNGAIDGSVRAAAAKELADFKMSDGTRNLTEDVRKLLGDGAIPTLTDAYLGNADAQGTLVTQLRALQKEHTSLDYTTEGTITSIDNTGIAARQLGDIVEGSNKTFADAVQKNKNVAAAMGTTEPAAWRLQDAIKTLGSTTASADDKARALKASFDALSGGSIGVANAQAAVDSTMARLNATIAQGVDHAKGFGSALLDSSGKLLTTSENGRTLQGTLNDLSSQAATLATSTLEASKAAGDDLNTSFNKVAGSAFQTREAFIQAAVQFGLTKEQAGQLATQYGLVPTLVATQVTQPGMPGAQAAADILRGKVIAVPDWKTTITQALTDEAVGRLQALGFTVTHLPDGTVRVEANTAPAWNAVDGLVRDASGKVIRIRVETSAGVANVGVGTGMPGSLQAEGGLVKAFASGGVHKLTPMPAGLAQVVKPNTWRVVGDRLRDDEFYIPDTNSPRSLALLSELARRRGFDLLRRYADGGVAARGAAPVTTQSTGPTGPFHLTGALNIGGTLFDLVDARIEVANQATGSAIRRGRR